MFRAGRRFRLGGGFGRPLCLASGASSPGAASPGSRGSGQGHCHARERDAGLDAGREVDDVRPSVGLSREDTAGPLRAILKEIAL